METVAIDTFPREATLAHILKQSRRTLALAGIDTAEQEACWLLEHALGTTRVKLHVDGDRRLSSMECVAVQHLVARRAAREPLQYILGTQEFYGLEIAVTPDVLIPRPESELVVEEARRCVAARRASMIVDVGTGSGCIAAAVASYLPQASVYAIDDSAAALGVARKNIERHGLGGRVTCLFGDLCRPLETMGLKAPADVILSNPPYVTEAEWHGLQPEVRDHEPRRALVAGMIGTEVHRRLLEEAWRFLAPSGRLIMEVGTGQMEAVCQLALESQRYGAPTIRNDSAGIARVVSLRKRRP